VMECVPPGRSESETVITAWALPFNAPVATAVPSMENTTCPVGVPVNCGLTVAVKLTACPEREGFVPFVKATETLLVACVTVCEIGLEALVPKLASPA
jgi:hypothetical protein